jgi:hypothetical protein
MMNEPHDALSGAPLVPASLDWRKLADQRLFRLVEIEHDHAVMCDRLALLQVDYRQMLVANEEQLQRIVEMDRERLKMERRLAELARECADVRAAFERMHASFVNSRSWRLTRPLRVISRWWVVDRHSIGGLVRAMLRIPLLRRGARFVVRRVPGLHGRLRARLYPQAGKIEREDLR